MCMEASGVVAGGFGGNCPHTFAKMVLEISLKSLRN